MPVSRSATGIILFQLSGPEMANARGPSVFVRDAGTTRSPCAAERSKMTPPRLLSDQPDHVDMVLPGLYLGNFRDAKDRTQLSDNKITHILSIYESAKPVYMDKKYLCITASDCATQNLSQYFSQTNDFIHKARTDGGCVLVHCLAGVSRSVTIVVAYIMSVTEYGWRDSLNAVRGARRCVNPNFGFQRQLLDFQHDGAPKERERLKKTFGCDHFEDTDECQRLLEINRQWVMNGDEPTDEDLKHSCGHSQIVHAKKSEKLDADSTTEDSDSVQKSSSSVVGADSSDSSSSTKSIHNPPELSSLSSLTIKSTHDDASDEESSPSLPQDNARINETEICPSTK